MADLSKWVTVSEAARLTGLSVRTIKRMAEEGQVKSCLTRGGHMRVLRADLDKLLRHASNAPVSASSVLQNKREGLETLNLELQERRVKRELAKFSEEDAEADRRRVAAAQAEELERKRAAEESRLQAERDAERRRSERRQSKIERKRREWVAAWVAWALNSVPKDAPREIELTVAEAVEEALAMLTSEQPQSTVNRLVMAAIAKALRPWQRQQEIERAVQESRKELPALLQRYFEPSEWEMRAMRAAREAISCLRADASYDELRAAAVQAGKEIAAQYEAEQARARAEAQGERDRQRREGHKSFLVSVGVAWVSPYISKLHSDGEIWDEDLARKSLASMARKNPAAVKLGRLGGKARAEKLSRAQKKEIARQGGFARWKKVRKHADHLPKAPKGMRSS